MCFRKWSHSIYLVLFFFWMSNMQLACCYVHVWHKLKYYESPAQQSFGTQTHTHAHTQRHTHTYMPTHTLTPWSCSVKYHSSMSMTRLYDDSLFCRSRFVFNIMLCFYSFPLSIHGSILRFPQHTAWQASTESSNQICRPGLALDKLSNTLHMGVRWLSG